VLPEPISDGDGVVVDFKAFNVARGKRDREKLEGQQSLRRNSAVVPGNLLEVGLANSRIEACELLEGDSSGIVAKTRTRGVAHVL
jgi:hypothetical protein